MHDAVRRFLTYLQEDKQRSENTLSAYEADLGQFVQFIQAMSGEAVELDSLTPMLIQEYADWLSEQRYRPSTIARKMAAVRSFLHYLTAFEGLVETDWSTSLQTPNLMKSKPHILNESELSLLLRTPEKDSPASDYRDSAILNLLYFTGLRASEIIDLKVSELLLDRGLIFRPGANPKEVQIGSAKPSLEQYLRFGRPYLQRGMVPELFLNQRGSRLTRQGLWLVVKKWAEQVGVENNLSPHTLRNTRTKHLLERGLSRKEIQRLLGLSSPNAIRVYYE